MDIQELFKTTVKERASDLHLLAGVPPAIRIDGALRYIAGYAPLKPEEIEEMVYSLLTSAQKELLTANKELDFSFAFGGGTYGDLGRFRINLYYQRRNLSGAFRLLSPGILSIEELHLPQVLRSFSDLTQGFVLITGPTGHGKSTTIASIINEINLKRAAHIVTIEDPIEYVYPEGKSIISQREMGIDTHSWDAALRAALREDPDVVLVGEMRDSETIAAAITIAETGHLVFSTLHTNSAAQSIDRIIDAFPATQQSQIKIQLAATLKGIVSQRLLPMISGGRVPAVEVLLGTPAVASIVRDGKTHLIDSVIQTSKDKGMIGIDSSLAALVLSGGISLDTGKSYALHQDDFLRMVE
ncbi:MAG: pilT [Candidatus Levybacteria bacterium]|nr:pilT [Candidatus Levybacteria bacterium]